MNYSQITEAIKTIVLAFTALFPLVNPVGGAPIFLSLTRQYPQPVQRVLARKIAVYGFALLAGSLVFGSFNGTINKLTFKLAPDQMTEADKKKAATAIARAKD